MTKKQINALRRILEREAVTYQARIGRPAPGQHQSEDKVAVTDGNICVLLDVTIPDLSMGDRADSFASIIRNERSSDSYFPVSADQIGVSDWRALAKKQAGDGSGIELTVQPDSNPSGSEQSILNPIMGRFNPQLLVDAVDAVGGKPQFFLGMGRFSSRFPSMLVFPPDWQDNDTSGPVVFVLSLRF